MMSISPERLTPLKQMIEMEKMRQRLDDQENAINYLVQENNAIIENLNRRGML